MKILLMIILAVTSMNVFANEVDAIINERQQQKQFTMQHINEGGLPSCRSINYINSTQGVDSALLMAKSLIDNKYITADNAERCLKGEPLILSKEQMELDKQIKLKEQQKNNELIKKRLKEAENQKDNLKKLNVLEASFRVQLESQTQEYHKIYDSFTENCNRNSSIFSSAKIQAEQQGLYCVKGKEKISVSNVYGQDDDVESILDFQAYTKFIHEKIECIIADKNAILENKTTFNVGNGYDCSFLTNDLH